MISAKVVAAVVVPLAWNNILLPRLRWGLRGRTVAHAAFATGYSLALGGRPRWVSARGARYGLAASAVVSTGYVVALTVPAVRDLLAVFADRSRTVGDPVVALDDAVLAESSTGAAVQVDAESEVVDPIERVTVHIPIGTVYSEELIFRATLDPLLDNTFGARIGPLASAAVFGLWHIHPARVAGDNVPATIALTTLGGLLFGLLSRHANSVTAPALLHFALNAGGVIAPLVAERRE